MTCKDKLHEESLIYFMTYTGNIYQIIFFFLFSVINPHLKTRSMKTAVHCTWEGGSLY